MLAVHASHQLPPVLEDLFTFDCQPIVGVGLKGYIMKPRRLSTIA